MARLCRAVLQLVLAVVVARGSVTISWNAHHPRPAVTAGPSGAQTAFVSAVHGTHVVLRLADGTSRVYIATPAQARALAQLVGTAIQFRLDAGSHK